MTRNSYPEEIYTTETGATITSPKKRRMVEKAYTLGTLRSGTTRQDLVKAYDAGFERGKQHKDNLTGWSNLTEAIAAGENIDWERLDGLTAKCVHPELGVLTHKLERDHAKPEYSADGWYTTPVDLAWENAIFDAWQGTGGWALYIKGDLPLRKQTADQLAPGTGFYGTHPESGEKLKGMVVVPGFGSYKAAIFTKPVPFAPASDVEVIEAYGVGTFCKPKEDA